MCNNNVECVYSPDLLNKLYIGYINITIFAYSTNFFIYCKLSAVK